MHEPASGMIVGATSSVAGSALLTFTSGNPFLKALSVFSMVAGFIILGSFFIARLASLRYRR